MCQCQYCVNVCDYVLVSCQVYVTVSMLVSYQVYVSISGVCNNVGALFNIFFRNILTTKKCKETEKRRKENLSYGLPKLKILLNAMHIRQNTL